MKMTERAEQIWEAYKGELINNALKDSEDVRQALATVIRNVANKHQYYHFGNGEDIVVDARLLYELADELEELE
jgi:hypothetical protein